MSSSARQLPRDARLVALLMASMGVDDAEPGVVAMLMEFAHRWASDVLSDSIVYAEHAHRNPPSTTPEMDDIKLAIQARLEQSMSNPWPREVLLSLAASVNKHPLPPIPESYGVRLPAERDRLTAINFNMIPKTTKLEEGQDMDEEGEESEDVEVEEEEIEDEEEEEEEEEDDLFDDDEVPPAELPNSGNDSNPKPATRTMDEDEDYD